MKKVISYSLWGQNPKYLTGALRNADVAKDMYPDWICRFYCFQCVPSPTIAALESRDNVEIILVPRVGDWRGLFNRFVAIDDPDVDIMIVRDCDSRITTREVEAVKQWLSTGMGFHIMRDHPYHKFFCLPGLIGVRKGTFGKTITQLINEFNIENKYGSDYEFFYKKISPLVQGNMFVHDEIFDGNSFPTQRCNLEFVGKVYEADESTVKEHEEILERYLISKGLME
jgi:protein O-GlcNAc transferase